MSLVNSQTEEEEEKQQTRDHGNYLGGVDMNTLADH